MKQSKLFDYEKTKNKFDIQQKMELPWYEDTMQLEFIAVPYALLLGSLSQEKYKLSIIQKMRLVRELLWPIAKPKANCDFEIQQYLESESKWLRKDKSKRLREYNRMSIDEFVDLLAYGALEISKRSKSIKSFKLLLRKNLPKCPYELKFSKLGRYILNGSNDEYWYRDTGNEIAELFSGFDRKLITSIIAITSIRSSVPTNASKLFKALQYFYQDRLYPVLIGQKGAKKKIESSFPGFLDASVIHLDKLKSGESLINPDKKNARKIRMFADAMLENIEAIVADIWIMRSFGCDLKYYYNDNLVSRSPSKSLYDAIEWYFQTLGNYSGKEPRGICSMVWSGLRSETTKSSTRYSETFRNKLDHGLFSSQFGKLVLTKDGVAFEHI